MKTKITRILWFALLGATGFGLGYWIRMEPILEGYTYLGYFGALMPGAFAGALLGIGSRMKLKKILLMVVMGSLGFGLALFLCALLYWLFGGEAFSSRPVLENHIYYIFAYGLTGALVGLAMGRVVGDLRFIVRMVVAGAVSFTIGFYISYLILYDSITGSLYPDKYLADHILFYLERILPGILSGALFGAFWGFFSKDNKKVSTRC